MKHVQYLKNLVPLWFLVLLLSLSTTPLVSCRPKPDDATESEMVLPLTTEQSLTRENSPLTTYQTESRASLNNNRSELIESSLPVTARYKITPINTIDDAADELNQAVNDDMVVWDIDETILESNDPSFQQRFTEPLLKQISFFSRARTLSILKRPDSVFKEQRSLVEPRIAELINDLQQRAVTVIALSAFGAGSYGQIKDLHELRHQELVRNGIDFDKELPVNSEMLNKELVNLSGNTRVCLKRGIVSSYNQDKGCVLSLFIKHMHMKPRKVIFIDDQLRNITTVAEHLQTIQIASSSYLYKATSILRPTDTIDWVIVEKQFALMRQKDEYVSYEEAKTSQALQQKLQNNALNSNRYSFIAESLPKESSCTIE